MNVKALLVTALSAVVMLTACESKQTKEAKTVEQVLNSQGTGTWTRVKDDSRIKGYSVFLGPDGKYHALDVSKYTQGMTAQQFLAADTVYDDLGKSIDTYQKYEETGSSTYSSYSCPYGGSDTSITCSENDDINGHFENYTVSETDYGWVTYNEDIYTDSKSGLVFDIGNTASKDLEAVAAQVNNQSISTLREQLVASYGLSEDRAQELASMGQSYQNIAKTRALTAKDLGDAQVKAFGVDLATVASAQKKAASGDNKDYNSLLQKAAQLNDISPEQAKSILNSFM